MGKGENQVKPDRPRDVQGRTGFRESFGSYDISPGRPRVVERRGGGGRQYEAMLQRARWILNEYGDIHTRRWN